MSDQQIGESASDLIDGLMESFIKDTEGVAFTMTQVWRSDRRMAFLAGMSAGFMLVESGRCTPADGRVAIDEAFEDAALALGMDGDDDNDQADDDDTGGLIR